MSLLLGVAPERDQEQGTVREKFVRYSTLFDGVIWRKFEISFITLVPLVKRVVTPVSEPSDGQEASSAIPGCTHTTPYGILVGEISTKPVQCMEKYTNSYFKTNDYD
ncbi:hypothetical protein AVEN_109044-1 [Araneus ventricosus]|uniref:Uncharacterized protein n=1 Tax=Araneus ventricosus TaxID=182803 RepID=A0A4Y2R8B9_ARAVE|nr:hypothetical protein AVEN_109044-1 [Araneus ventricosus]